MSRKLRVTDSAASLAQSFPGRWTVANTLALLVGCVLYWDILLGSLVLGNAVFLGALPVPNHWMAGLAMGLIGGPVSGAALQRMSKG